MPKLGVKSRGETQGTILRFPVDRRQNEPVASQPPSPDLGAVLITLIERCRRKIAPGLSIRLSAGPASGVTIAPEEAATLDYVVGELVSNAYRHSHPTGSPVEVTIECGVSREGEIVIDIGDDGIGLPPDFAEWRDAGNGMVSVRYRLQQVGAQLNVTSDDLGLRFQIILHPRHLRATPARGNFVWL
jgi:two-component sensor histidine kinase